MLFHLDRNADQPLYRQIAAQIRQAIRGGDLPNGTRLPSVRQMAKVLGVTRLTIETAYNELRADGWIASFVGQGTFVADSAASDALMRQIGHDPAPDAALKNIPVLDQISIVRSLAYAEPDFLPTDLFWNELKGLREEAAELSRYASPQGDPLLRIAIRDVLRERGIEALPDDIIVTAGVTQGIALIAQALTRPGDVVLVEQPTHIGLLHTLKSFGLQPVGVPFDDEGPRLDIMEQVLMQYPARIFYTIPTFHNPTGSSMSVRRRADLLRLAKQHHLLLVEDDIYGLLNYDGVQTPALKSLDENEQVIYLGGFSKVLMPGLRVGYLIAPNPMRQRLLSLRQAFDLCSPNFVQRALAAFIQRGELTRHLRHVIPIYKRRRDALLSVLQTHMPPDVRWTTPAGGFSCLLTLPPELNEMDVCRIALERGFAFTQGSAFVTEKSGSYVRICFGAQPENVIREAIQVLGEVIRQRGRSINAILPMV